MKVKELIEKLSTMPPEVELVSYQSDMEKSGIRPIFYNPTLEKYKIKRKSTYDRFDYTDYTYEVYVEDENGEIIAVRM